MRYRGAMRVAAWESHLAVSRVAAVALAIPLMALPAQAHARQQLTAVEAAAAQPSAQPAVAPVTAPSVATPPVAEPSPAAQTWEEALGGTAKPAPAPAPIPAPVVVEPQVPVAATLVRPSDQDLEDTRRSGRNFLIAAGATAGVATLLNGLRAYLVTGPCQSETQEGCSLGWFTATPFTFVANTASAVLAAVGGGNRGKFGAWDNPRRQRMRSGVMVSVGIPLLCLGALASISLRSLWLTDYTNPGGRASFDFARPGHAFGYYGGQQLSALAFAAGAGMISYHAAGSRVRRATMTATPWVGSSYAGVQLRSRF